MSGEDLTQEVKDLIKVLKPQNEAILDIAFKVNILWRVFTWGCGVVGLGLLTALLTLLIKKG